MPWVCSRLSVSHRTYGKTDEWQVQEFFTNSIVQLRLLYELRTTLTMELENLPPSYSKPTAERTITLLTRHVRHLGKFFRRLQQLSVSRFILLPSCNDLVLYYWSKVVHATSGPASWIAGVHIPIMHLIFRLSALQIALWPSILRSSLYRRWYYSKRAWHNGRQTNMVKIVMQVSVSTGSYSAVLTRQYDLQRCPKPLSRKL